LIRQNRNPFYDTAIGGQANVVANDWHHFFVFVGENFAKPSDTARQREPGAENAHRHARH
jgi:hypothetical protein